jgi:hypothetical protein
MSSKAGEYDHLGETVKVPLAKEPEAIVSIDIQEVADRIVELNYGTHRLLSALIRARRHSEKFQKRYEEGNDELANKLEEMLGNGLY